MPADYNHPSNSQVLAGLIRRFHEARSSGGASVTCWGIGSPVREFLHGDDLADAAVFCLEQWQASRARWPIKEQAAQAGKVHCR